MKILVGQHGMQTKDLYLWWSAIAGDHSHYAVTFPNASSRCNEKKEEEHVSKNHGALVGTVLGSAVSHANQAIYNSKTPEFVEIWSDDGMHYQIPIQIVSTVSYTS